MTIDNDDMTDDNFYQFLYDAFDNMVRYTEEGGAIYVFHADTYGDLFRKAFKEAGYKLSQILIWVKNVFVMGRQDYHWRHEPIIYGWKEGAAHLWNSDRRQQTVQDRTKDLSAMTKEELLEIVQGFIEESSVIYHDRPSRSAQHPTMKPVSLIGYLMKNSSRRGDVILDPFGGSGSTLIAADQLGRIARLVELDPIYCQVIVDRYRIANPDVQVKINGKPYTR